MREKLNELKGTREKQVGRREQFEGRKGKGIVEYKDRRSRDNNGEIELKEKRPGTWKGKEGRGGKNRTVGRNVWKEKLVKLKKETERNERNKKKNNIKSKV